MEAVHRVVSRRLLPLPFARKSPLSFTHYPFQTTLLSHTHKSPSPKAAFFVPSRRTHSSSPLRAGWFKGLGEKKAALPDIVKAGDPVLHEPARDVDPQEIGSERIQKIIDDMVEVMRKEPGVGLAAPQIGFPLRVGLKFLFCFVLFFHVL